ncbi:unnamed protein product [Vitrella brassicaformis CCMP3155]|uniref:Uncharacterized protein n=1 Tax=Vitrella brassicaformis (strain CCMP3155) TaxID=1169540 RepID=A0A0G4GGD2_VITBC|nr:unnamed protein product [Vitrella brassicaformis CCMP3155]|eukprot:CEM28677.1 unnamed protein product [Vitrella brassicaformis CCMP3155]
MAASAAQMSTAAMRDQLLAQIQAYQTNQARVNNGIGRFSQMVANVTRQLSAESARLAQLADNIDSTIALTTHTRTRVGGGTYLTFPRDPLVSNALRPIFLNIWLRKAIEWAGVGGVVQSDDQLSHGDVMKAMWLMEEGGEGGWGEVADTLSLAEHLGYCQLPITVGAGDLQTHATKAEYSSLPRFCAQWMLVGRHVAFRRPNGQQDGTLQLFRYNNEIRAIHNQPGFAITLNPPLPQPTRPVHPFSRHPFQQDARPHDPPVRSRIWWAHGVGWTGGGNAGGFSASASSLLKRLLLTHRSDAFGDLFQSPPMPVDRGVRGGYLDRIMTQSPHTPLDACSHVTAWERADGTCAQAQVLTSSADAFIAYIAFFIPYTDPNVRITIATTEAPAAGVANDAPFARRFPLTAAKGRLVLGPIAPIVLDGQAP